MIAQLDENNYYTGHYATVGSVENGVAVKELPGYEELERQLACKYINGNWIFDENKYQEILKAKEKENTKGEIAKLQRQLADTDYKIIKCSEYQLAGLEIPYNVAELHQERQTLRDKINELEGD